jgi:hypothetical protein
VKMIVFVLSPINASVVDFLNPSSIRHKSRQGSEPWREWIETMYVVAINSSLGSGFIYLSGLHDLPAAVWKGCHDFCYTNKLEEELVRSIVEKLYSPELLALQ